MRAQEVDATVVGAAAVGSNDIVKRLALSELESRTASVDNIIVTSNTTNRLARRTNQKALEPINLVENFSLKERIIDTLSFFKQTRPHTLCALASHVNENRITDTEDTS